jgi:hypothetical protein
MNNRTIYTVVGVIVLGCLVFLVIFFGVIKKNDSVLVDLTNTPTTTNPLQIIPYLGSGLPTMSNTYDIPKTAFAVQQIATSPAIASHPGARSLLISHISSTDPFKKTDGSYYDAIRYRLGLLLGGTALYSLPTVELELSRKLAKGQSSSDSAYVRNNINVVCGGEFQVDTDIQELVLVVRKTHLPNDDGSFLAFADKIVTANGALNPSTWKFTVEFASRNGLPHDVNNDGIVDQFFTDVDNMAPLSLWR